MNTPSYTTDGLRDFLTAHPWPEEWAHRALPVEYYFSFTLPATPAELWPIVSDTSRLNELMGYPSMSFTERNGRRFGSYRLAGMRQEWEEPPWEWEAERSITMTRIFSKGIARYLRGMIDIEPALPGTARVQVYFGWIPRHLPARLLLIGARTSFGNRFANAFAALVPERTLAGAIILQPVDYLRQTSTGTAANGERLAIAKHALLADGGDPDTTVKLAAHIAAAPDVELHRMRPRALARTFATGEEATLGTMLRGTRRGMLSMNWDVVCPHCRGVRARINHLWEVPAKGRCDACQVDFDTSSLNAVEITFQPRPEIRRVEEVLYCSAEPARKPHIRIQRAVDAESVLALPLALAPGRYRLRTVGGTIYHLLDVREDAPRREILWDADATAAAFETGSGAVLVMRNPGTAPRTFVVEEHELDRDALRPRDLFNLQDFRDLFADESLPADLSIDVGMQNIMFVDIVGSTVMYGREGDSRAFTIVRAFFRASHDLAAAHRGAIIKTMGDAVMASFDDPMDALRCARAFVTTFDGRDPEAPLRTRVTINRGPCLAVNLNSAIDYFGQPVNVAAKLQPFAGAGEIALVEAFMEDEAVRAYFAAKGHARPPLRAAEIAGAGTVRYLVMRPINRTRGDDSEA